MKRSILRITGCMAAVILSAALSLLSHGATTYFVATNGFDFINSGLSNASPWRSLAYAIQVVAPGDIINVDAGDYTEGVLSITTPVTISGTNLYFATNAPLSRHLSRTVIHPLYTNNPAYPMIIEIKTNGVTIRNITIDGNIDLDGTPGIDYAIYSTNKPINVNHCIIRNIGKFGITCYGLTPAASTDDTDAVRSYLGYNLITNIISTNLGKGTAIMLEQAPATCEFNEISQVRGSNSNAGLYMINCMYTAKMTNWVTIRSNYFDYCTTAIRANQFGTAGEKIIISANTITNSLLGIRVTAAQGQALILSNLISVSGISESSRATPARGIWIQADNDPWGTTNTLLQTDHLILGNTISGLSTAADGTVGILLSYSTETLANGNNGIRATVLNNSISQFDYGVYISSGTNNITNPHTPLVSVAVHTNDFSGNISYGLYATGMTEMVNASNNWWGYYFGPTGIYGNAVTTNVLFSWPLGAYFLDSNSNGTNNWLDPDDDGDQISDLIEMQAGTDPANSLSMCKILNTDINPGSGWLEFSWMSAPGWRYNVYRSSDLATGTFLRVTNNIPAAYPAVNTYTDTTTGLSPYFYKLTVTN